MVDLVLIHFIGLYAAVISTAVAYLPMAIYRHYDLKKYVKIRYRARDLILAVSVLAAVSAIYYLGNFWLYAVGVVLAGVYLKYVVSGTEKSILRVDRINKGMKLVVLRMI